MFQKILVPTDLTERTTEALETALHLAAGDGAKVTLLHVIETVPNLSFDELEPFYRDLASRARARMGRFASSAARKPDVDLSMEIVYGRRAEEILRCASDGDVDLIVLPSHPVDAAHPALGSISYKVSIFARCPVLLLK
jgi:universal stress protein A